MPLRALRVMAIMISCFITIIIAIINNIIMILLLLLLYIYIYIRVVIIIVIVIVTVTATVIVLVRVVTKRPRGRYPERRRPQRGLT